MTSQPPIVWRIAAAALWLASIACLLHAITGGVTAEESLYNPQLSDADRVAIHHLAEVSDRWAAIGWFLQFTTAAVLSFGLTFPRVVRRIFVSLGIVIAVDGVALLLSAVMIR